MYSGGVVQQVDCMYGLNANLGAENLRKNQLSDGDLKIHHSFDCNVGN